MLRRSAGVLTPSRAQIYPLDAVFDTPEDVPEDIKARAAAMSCGEAFMRRV